MKAYEVKDGELLISDDKRLLDRAVIHEYLATRSYWAKGLPLTVMERSIENSLCLGAYLAGKQIGFARVVTDSATFAWLADVFILEDQRGHGFSKKLIAAVRAHPQLQGLRRFLLGTADAHGLYQQFDFEPIKHPERFMEICPQNPYNCM
ncbi:MAG TPA: GNAT family N-acetyltransferase [Verrucomicrobiae bacterium]|nr:GNAT family N-acetyltransferase [Verrucomicrobiae bacterium]